MKLEQVPTPSYIIDLGKLEENCRILQEVQEKGSGKHVYPGTSTGHPVGRAAWIGKILSARNRHQRICKQGWCGRH